LATIASDYRRPFLHAILVEKGTNLVHASTTRSWSWHKTLNRLCEELSFPKGNGGMDD
jgi:hypothetical protein